MDQESLGKKLQSAREKCGLSQEEVEHAIGLPQKALTRIESGKRLVSTLELSKFAALFNKPIADFFEQSISNDDLLVALHRLAPGLEKSQKIHEAVARCVHMCREGCLLEKLIGLPSRDHILAYSYPCPKNTIDAVKQGEQVARDERRRLGLGNQPVYDIIELLSCQGIWCAGTVLPAEMSGLFLHHPSLGMAILVNAKHSRARKLFSYAHEYAHALFDQNRNILVSAADNAADLIEKRANAFAAAFLLPKEAIAEMVQSLGKGLSSRSNLTIFDVACDGVIEAEDRQNMSMQKLTFQDIALIAHHFGVSYQATVYRLHSLRYLSQNEREVLLSAEPYGKDYLRLLNFLEDLEEPEQSSQQMRELKAHLCRLIIEAYKGEKISRGRLMELSKLIDLRGEQLLKIANSGMDAGL
jgi:Zn-dependent peptidase ImmA (M78 family)/transcriptional regulator with XRE-family HTH domain